jgi:hypothetical protein
VDFGLYYTFHSSNFGFKFLGILGFYINLKFDADVSLLQNFSMSTVELKVLFVEK